MNTSLKSCVAVTHHLLVLELLRDVARAAARDLDPRLGEDGAGGDGERDVDERVHGVEEGGLERVRGRHVVRDTGYGLELWRALDRLPNAKEAHEEVIGETAGEHL